MEVKAVYLADEQPAPFRAFDVTITVGSDDDKDALKKLGYNNVTIPELVERNSGLTEDQRRALKTFHTGVNDALSSIAAPELPSGKVAAARLKP